MPHAQRPDQTIFVVRNCLKGPIETHRLLTLSPDQRTVTTKAPDGKTKTYKGEDWWKTKKLARQEAQRRRLAKIEELERRCDILRHLWKGDP